MKTPRFRTKMVRYHMKTLCFHIKMVPRPMKTPHFHIKNMLHPMFSGAGRMSTIPYKILLQPQIEDRFSVGKMKGL
jgi:hypothetical protein